MDKKGKPGGPKETAGLVGGVVPARAEMIEGQLSEAVRGSMIVGGSFFPGALPPIPPSDPVITNLFPLGHNSQPL